MIKVYGAVRVIRLMLSRHPRAAAVELPPYIGDGNIWTL
jgi:hypothetical protein